MELPHHLILMDLGTGGGSPAIPLALALEARRLVMVESKSRKAAFLREAVRAVELDAIVESDRFEAVAEPGAHLGQKSAGSILAVRGDQNVFLAAQTLLQPKGKGALLTRHSTLPAAWPHHTLHLVI